MTFKTALLALLLTVPALALSQAQGGPPAGGPPGGRGMGAARMYDPATVVTVSGSVVAENRVARGNGHAGVHLILNTSDGQIPVHLGPASWVDGQTLKIATGDEVTVKGSRTTFNDKPVLIAETISKGGSTLVLRDPRGVPAWRGQGQGQGPRAGGK